VLIHKGFDNEIRIDLSLAMPHNTRMEAVAADSRLAAVMARDRKSDGAFVYAVRSTGIFCRPSCASRRPRLDRISFFSSAEEAREAGFRACRRCQPDSTDAAEKHLAQRICEYIGACEDQLPSLTELSDRFGFSPHHLARTFKAAVGMTPKAYASLERIERLRARLRGGEKVTDALYGAGYGSSSRLYEHGDRVLGMSPSDYRAGGRGSLVRFTIVTTRFGTLLAAATPKGICAVSLGESDAALERRLHREYASARIERDDRALRPIVERIVANIERGEGLNGFTVDVAATAFTRSVWKALAAIPYGQTRTYGEIAAAIGRPGAARAVARACASNHVALVIPCHRAVPRAGGSGGYRWGPARKRAILQREGQLASTKTPE
jgi:AraC family transcriptional regulator, regulatory protein of adaptative response / methylated-DNA-[protein]-cysteine methyltransferase